MKLSDIPADVRDRAPHLMELIRASDIELPDPEGWQLLCLQYVRADNIKTAGGIIIPTMVAREDEYQGRIGLVLAVGQNCWSDSARFPTGPRCMPGDAIIWPSAGAAAQRFKWGAVQLTLIPDTSVLATIPHEVDLAKVVGG